MQSYDTASIGSSALLAALKRNLRAEVAFWIGDKFAAILNDYDKSLDNIEISTLLEKAVYIRFPASKMAFSLQQHLAPRVLQVGGESSKPLIYAGVFLQAVNSAFFLVEFIA